MNIEIRNIVSSDYDSLVKFWTEQEGVHLNDADSKENIERYLQRNPHMSFLVSENGAIVGTAMAGHDGRRGYLFHVAVAPSHRGMGLAKKLLDKCYESLLNAGIAKCYVFLLKNNESGKDYWAKQDWSHVNEFELMSKWIGKEKER